MGSESLSWFPWAPYIYMVRRQTCKRNTQNIHLVSKKNQIGSVAKISSCVCVYSVGMGVVCTLVMGGGDGTWKLISSVPLLRPLPWFLRRDLSLNLELADTARRTGQQTQGCAVPVPSSPLIPGLHHHAWSFIRMLGIQTQVCSQGNHFNPLSHLPSFPKHLTHDLHFMASSSLLSNYGEKFKVTSKSSSVPIHIRSPDPRDSHCTPQQNPTSVSPITKANDNEQSQPSHLPFCPPFPNLGG